MRKRAPAQTDNFDGPREAREQQAATAEVLQVISPRTADWQWKKTRKSFMRAVGREKLK
jgi:hypothetical protein